MRRLVALILFVGLACYLLISPKSITPSPTVPQPQSPQEILEAEYETYPVYEYESLYRIHSSKDLESKLDRKLQKLEQSTRKTYNGSLHAPKTIWQLCTKDAPSIYKPWMEQWRNKNPEWEYKAFTSPPTELFMYFTGIPELAAVYNDIEEVRPDLMRWLLLWYHGGVFADVDTWDRIGMRGCKPTKDVVQERRDVSLVIGIETDEPFLSQEGLRKFGLTRGFGFGNVVVWAPKRFDPVVRRAIVYTVSHARAHLNKSITALNEMSKRKEEYLDELSGKHMFTDALLEVLSDSLEKGHALRDGDAGLERRVTWKWFKGLKNPLWIMSDEATKEKREAQMRGLAILPIKTWSSGQNHSDSGSMEDVAACVNHAPGRRPGKRGSV